MEDFEVELTEADGKASPGWQGAGILVLFIALVLVVISQAVIFQKRFETNVIEQFQHHQLTIVKGVSKGIEGELNHIKVELERLAEDTDIQSLNPERYDQALRRSIVELGDLVLRVSLLDRKGVILMEHPFMKKDIGTTVPETVYLQQAMTSSKTVVGGPFKPFKGSFAISIITPVFNNRAPIGAVRALVNLDVLAKEFVLNLVAFEKSYAFLMDRYGLILYHPKGKYVGKRWEQVGAGSLKSLVEPNNAGYFRHYNTISEGTEELIAYSPVNLGYNNLVVVLVSPKASFYAPLSQNKRHTWAFVVALLSIVALGVYKFTEVRGRKAILEREREHMLRLRELDDAVRASEKLYRALLESSYDSIILLDLDGKVVTCNKTATRAMQQGKVESLVGKPLIPLYPESCRPDVRVALERVGQGEAAVIKLQTYTSTGASRWWECTFIPVENEDRQVVNILATARDISDNKRTNEKLLETRRYLTSLIDSSADAIISTNKDGNVVIFSKGAETMLGYQQQDIVGRYVTMLYESEDGAKDVMQQMRKNNGWVSAYETVLRAKDGSLIPVLISASILYDKEGHEAGTVGFNKDLRERKRAERALAVRTEELARSNAELQEFARVASHDLQEPLRKVKAFGHRLKSRSEDALGEEGLNYLDRMLAATERMQDLITGLLSYSRVTTKGQPFVKVNLAQVAHEVVSDLEGRIEKTGGVVKVGDLATIEADPLQMRQLIQNLVSNSLKFHKPGEPPVVTVRGMHCNGHDRQGGEGFQGGDHYKVLVEDNGIGFDQKYAERIFGVFQRLHGRSEYDGSGVGLAICRKITERHGGTIEAKSIPGGGTTFAVTLPVKHPKGENNDE